MPVVILDNFRGGEHGSLGPRNPPPGSYHGLNVLTFQNGSVGPRSGFSQVAALTGNASNLPRLWAASPASSDTSTYPRIIGQGGATGTKIYDAELGAGYTRTDAAPAMTGYTGTLLLPWVKATALTTGVPRVIFSGGPGSTLYAADPATHGLSALASTPAGTAMAVHGGRLVVGGPDQYLRYSDASNFGTFNALSTIPVGADWNPVAGLYAMQDRLIIAKTDGTWWMLTGVPGVNETLRRVYDGLGINRWHAGMVTPGGTMWFCPEKADYPVQFTGSTMNELKHLSERDILWTGQPYISAANSGSMWSPLGGGDEALMLSGSNFTGVDAPRFLMFRNGAWTRHTLNYSVFETAFNAGRLWTLMRAIDKSGIVVMWNGGPSLGTPALYAANFELDRPGFLENFGGSRTYATGDFLDKGGAIATLFEPPQQWSEEEVTVRRVIVEYSRWDLGAAGNVGFTVAVNAYGRIGAAFGPVTSTPQTVSVAQGASTGTVDSADLFFGDQGPGRGWQLSFSALKGVAIRAIRVEYS